MKICSEMHDEIVYESIECPFCAMIREFENDIENLQDEIEHLKHERVRLYKEASLNT